MKNLLCKFLPVPVACLTATAVLRAETGNGPQARDLSRFETIWQKSPFVAVTDLSGQVDDLAGRFVLTGFARLGEKDVVFLFDNTTLERFQLSAGDIRQGLALESLRHEGDLKSVRATMASGGRTIELAYDPARVPDSGQQVQAGMPGMPVMPGQPGQPVRVYPGQPGQPGQMGYPPQMQQPGQVMMGQPGQQGMPQNNPNQIVGASPDTGEPPPPPRRVIRRRAIVAPE